MGRGSPLNALEIVEAVRQHGAIVVVENGQLVVRGSGQPLPENLRLALREHRPAIMVALGTPLDTVIAGILADIRPHLPQSLRNLPDEKLLALVNWSIMAAWEKALRSLN